MNDAPGLALELAPWRVSRILADERGLLVVDKPPGMPVHGGPAGMAHAVVDRLAAHRVRSGQSRYLGVHQRLDQDTSGVLLFTTDEARNAEVSRAILERTLVRRYVAVVDDPNRRLDASGRFEFELEMDGERARVVARGGKRAATRYWVMRRVGRRALLELELETGRTHQIRVSLAHVGAPVVGDRLYGGAPFQRLLLHAASLSGGPLERAVSSRVPECFEAALLGAPHSFPTDAAETLLDAACLRAPLTEESSAFRLVNGEGDGLPGLTVDVYGRYATLNVYEESLVDRSLGLAETLGQLGILGVVLKRRVKKDLRAEDARLLAPESPLFGQAPPRGFAVRERGMVLEVDLTDGLSTGLFVDQRDNHHRAREWAGAGAMLNLFCYTGAFSVSAALGSARTTNVDLSGAALARSRRNFEQNGLDPNQHRFFKEDAMKYLARAVRRGERYDFVVLDPPSFASVKKGTFSVRGRYGEAVTASLELLSPGGRLLTVTNHTKTSYADLREMIGEAARVSGRRIARVKEPAPGLDVPEHSYGPWPSKNLLVEVEP